jgi:DNA-binding CsgD family transcriptional regulator
MIPAKNKALPERYQRPAKVGIRGPIGLSPAETSLRKRLFAIRAELLEIDRIQREKQALIVSLNAGLARACDFLSRLQSTARTIASASESSRQCVVSSKTLLREGTPPDAAADSNALAFPALTKREARVLMLVAAGKTNKEIGHELAISVKTVEFHRASGLKKLHLRSRAEIVRYALRHGWLGPNFEVSRAPPKRNAIGAQ